LTPMPSHPPTPISSHRLKRIALWAMAMLLWIAAVCGGAAPSRRHLQQRGDTRLDELARMVRNLVIVRAVAMVKPPRRPARHGPRRRPRHYLRSCAGAELRRLLRARDPQHRVLRLIAALRDLAAYAARLARRLARGLTRLAPLAAAARNETLCALASPPVRATDSS
ncbi:MAG: hypothetical protein AB7Q23_17975, partial [Hyphomonadaceae bacterium]